MGQRFRNSLDLVKASAQVLKTDKQLVVFPIVSILASILVIISFAIPTILLVMASGGIKDDGASVPMGARIGMFAIGFTFYLVQYFVIIFSNVALVGAVMIRLKGGTPTLRDGFNVAASRTGAILGYSAISATVGMVLRYISEETGILGNMLTSLLGTAWTVATYLVAPVLVMEKVGPVEAIKRSTALLKKTWGEQIIGGTGISLVMGIIVFLMVLLFIPIIMACVATSSVALIVTVSVLFAISIMAMLLISSTMTGIYTAAVYLYAEEGISAGPYSMALIQGAFVEKPKNKGIFGK